MIEGKWQWQLDYCKSNGLNPEIDNDWETARKAFWTNRKNKQQKEQK